MMLLRSFHVAAGERAGRTRRRLRVHVRNLQPALLLARRATVEKAGRRSVVYTLCMRRGVPFSFLPRLCSCSGGVSEICERAQRAAAAHQRRSRPSREAGRLSQIKGHQRQTVLSTQHPRGSLRANTTVNSPLAVVRPQRMDFSKMRRTSNHG